MKKRKLMGTIEVMTAAVLWAVTGVIGQELSQKEGFDPAWVVSVRMLAAGALLAVINLIRYRAKCFILFRSSGDRLRLLCFTLFGSGLVQLSYFYAVAVSNAATATFIQYLSPAIVVVAVAAETRKLPSRAELLCVVLAVCGTFLIATHGSVQSLSLSKEALFWGLLAAASLAVYTLYPQQLMKKYGFSMVLGWSLLLGGVLLSVLMQPWRLSCNLNAKTMGILAFLIICGTVAAFLIYAIGVSVIGGARANMIATLEPLTSAVLTAVCFGISFTGMDLIGFACILSITFILAWDKGS